MSEPLRDLRKFDLQGLLDVLRWSEARYNHTLQLVAHRLESTGLRLANAGWDSYAIVSRLHPYDEPLGRTRWLERSITTQAGLAPVEAQQLYWLTPTADSWRRDLTQEQRQARRRLERQGLLVEEPAGLMISAAVSYSLRLPIELEGEFNAIHR